MRGGGITALPTITPIGSPANSPGEIIPTCSASSIIHCGKAVPPVERSPDHAFTGHCPLTTAAFFLHA